MKEIADEIHHQPNVETGMLIGRNVPTAFQPLSVIYGNVDEPWAEEYKFGWTIIGRVCLDGSTPKPSQHKASVNRVIVQREQLLHHSNVPPIQPVNTTQNCGSSVTFIAATPTRKMLQPLNKFEK